MKKLSLSPKREDGGNPDGMPGSGGSMVGQGDIDRSPMVKQENDSEDRKPPVKPNRHEPVIPNGHELVSRPQGTSDFSNVDLLADDAEDQRGPLDLRQAAPRLASYSGRHTQRQLQPFPLAAELAERSTKRNSSAPLAEDPLPFANGLPSTPLNQRTEPILLEPRRCSHPGQRLTFNLLNGGLLDSQVSDTQLLGSPRRHDPSPGLEYVDEEVAEHLESANADPSSSPLRESQTYYMRENLVALVNSGNRSPRWAAAHQLPNDGPPLPEFHSNGFWGDDDIPGRTTAGPPEQDGVPQAPTGTHITDTNTVVPPGTTGPTNNEAAPGPANPATPPRRFNEDAPRPATEPHRQSRFRIQDHFELGAVDSVRHARSSARNAMRSIIDRVGVDRRRLQHERDELEARLETMTERLAILEAERDYEEDRKSKRLCRHWYDDDKENI